MPKLRKLRVRGFRGILNDAELDFGKKCQSLIVVGNNGTGKSSLVDAVEWLLRGRVEHLNREGCGDRAKSIRTTQTYSRILRQVSL